MPICGAELPDSLEVFLGSEDKKKEKRDVGRRHSGRPDEGEDGRG